MNTRAPKAKAKKKYGTWFFCETCGGIEVPSMKDHLIQKHGLAVGMKGTSQMVMHMDARESYSGTVEYHFGDVVMTREYHLKRDKADMMRWA